eukprot:COSAG01_NODE_20346_length_958_cov_3.678696_1_plen_157_part_00
MNYGRRLKGLGLSIVRRLRFMHLILYCLFRTGTLVPSSKSTTSTGSSRGAIGVTKGQPAASRTPCHAAACQPYSILYMPPCSQPPRHTCRQRHHATAPVRPTRARAAAITTMLVCQAQRNGRQPTQQVTALPRRNSKSHNILASGPTFVCEVARSC